MPWGPLEKKNWLEAQKIERSYKAEVVEKLEELSHQHAAKYTVESYGALSIDPERYPLFYLVSKNFDPSQKVVLVTGGVHGYETSGVLGALHFFKEAAGHYEKDFQFICAPCVSPWGYETINRWNPKAIDPNRSFTKDSPSEECRLFLNAMASLGAEPLAHFDLHETTDTDNTIFRPALEQRDGLPQERSEIPDGFYVVGDEQNPQASFQKAIIDRVRTVTHIAPPDKNGKIIGKKIEQEGVVNYPLKQISLCAGFSDATYTTTTEVYPDSPTATPALCIEAQVAAICGGLDYVREATRN